MDDNDSLFKEERKILNDILPHISKISWEDSVLKSTIHTFVNASGISLKQVAQSLRLALTGKKISPPIFDVMTILGRKETLQRIVDFVDGNLYIVSVFDIMVELGRDETIKRLTNKGEK